MPALEPLTDVYPQSVGKERFFSSLSIVFFFYLQKEKITQGEILNGARSLGSDFEFFHCLEIHHRIFRAYDAALAATRARHLQCRPEPQEGRAPHTMPATSPALPLRAYDYSSPHQMRELRISSLAHSGSPNGLEYQPGSA